MAGKECTQHTRSRCHYGRFSPAVSATSLQVNALSPFLLTRLLLPNLRRASEAAGGGPGSARVLYLGSMLDKGGDLSDLNNIPDFLSLQRFASSKVRPSVATLPLVRNHCDGHH